MKWFHKGFILAAACFLLATGAVEAAPVVEPPAVVITHNRIIGDSPAILFSGSAYMKPLIPMDLHLRANEDVRLSGMDLFAQGFPLFAAFG